MTLLHLGRAILETAYISVPTVLDAASGRCTSVACDRRLDAWSRRLLEQADISIEVVGLDHAPFGEAFVVMSNHQSLYDIPVVFQALSRRVRMVAKTELFRVPVWGSAMRAAGFIEVDRQDRERAIASLRRARDALEAGTSIWIAPEGTRSQSGRLGPFKQGGFHLALETGARILPIVIDGTRDALLARGWTVRAGKRVRVTVCPPIIAAEYGHPQRLELTLAVRRAIAAHLPQERAQTEPEPEKPRAARRVVSDSAREGVEGRE
jgi:1-acyl-sn-glycerol-3-phosphate acyltransferase